MKTPSVIATLLMPLMMGGCTGAIWSQVISFQAAEREMLGSQM